MFRMFRICKGVAHIAILFVADSHTHVGIRDLSQDIYNMMHGHARPTGNVHHLTYSFIHSSCTNIRFDHVRNVSEIACLLTISVDRQGLMLKNSFAETMEGHIGSLARSIHRKVAQDDRAQPQLQQWVRQAGLVPADVIAMSPGLAALVASYPAGCN